MCPNRRVNLAEKDGETVCQSNPIFDDTEDDVSDDHIDLLPVQSENLVIRCILTSTKAHEKDDWRCKGNFLTRVL